MSQTTTVAAGLDPTTTSRDRPGVPVSARAPAHRPHAGGRWSRLAAGSRVRPLLLGEIVLVAFLLFGYDRIASVANAHAAAAMRHGWALWRLEHVLHLAVELPLNGLVASHRLLTQGLALYYDFAHGLVTFGVLASLYVFRARSTGRPATHSC